MEHKIEVGTKGYHEIIVSYEATAARYGSGLVEVFATPAMIALMEYTCQCSIQEKLPEGYITVGTEVNVKHLKATPIGMKVWCESELLAVEGRQLIFRVDAHDEKGKIGTGTHKRMIVNSKNFMNRIGS